MTIDELRVKMKKYILQIAFGAPQGVVKGQMEKDGQDPENLDVAHV